MLKLLDPESPVMTVWSRLADLAILSVLWLLCCLPVITIGASTAALSSATCWLAEGNGKVVSRFLTTFKDCFKTATVLWLLVAAVGAALYGDFYLLSAANSPLRSALLLVLGILAVLYAMVSVYAFPLCARYRQGVRKTVKNCFMMAVAYLPRTAVMLAVQLIPVAIFLCWTRVFFQLWYLWVFIAFGLISYIKARLLIPIFRKVETTEDDQ